MGTTVRVQVANGAIVPCSYHIPDCEWAAAGHQFNCNMKILPLGKYDGILGIDWLMEHSPMQVHWRQKWMRFSHRGSMITLQGKLNE